MFVNKPALKIACIGEAMIEMIVHQDTFTADLGVAGDVLNACIYLRRNLDARHTVSFFSAIGTDAMSDRIIEQVQSEGISTQNMQRNPNKVPGIYSIQTAEDGERSFCYWRNDSAARTMFSNPNGADFSSLDEFDVVFFSAITLAILPQSIRDALFDWIAGFRARGGRVAFDSNFRPTLWENIETAQAQVTRAWSLTDIALPSVDDEMDLFADTDEAAVLKRLREIGVCCGALKRGEKGPLAISQKPVEHIDYPAAIRVVDTTAAGDSFDGAFLASYLMQQDIGLAMKAGHECSVQVIGYPGAIMPKNSVFKQA
jgi:2-dehydro-3-deoxygluconokinase